MNKSMTVSQSNDAASFTAQRLLDAVADFGEPITQAPGMFTAWLSRSKPRGLDNHTLRDLGLLRTDIEYSVGKRFWQE
jgi:uncharacterized protein YjiS (DUF1127 family)